MEAYEKMFGRPVKDAGSPVVELGGSGASPEHTVSDENMLEEPSPKRARVQATSPQSKMRGSSVSDVLGHVQRKPRTSRPATGRHKASSSFTADEQDPDDKAAAEALLGFSTAASTSSPPHRPATSRAQTPTRRGATAQGSPRFAPSALQPSAHAPTGRGGRAVARQPEGSDTPKVPQGARGRRGAGPTASPVKAAPMTDIKPAATAASTTSGKSELTLLCERFLERYGRLRTDGRAAEIQLKDVALDLFVPRRRLYDIINVLEAVEMVVRTGKLQYEWQGVAHLPQLLQQLAKEEADGMPVEDRSRRGPPVVLRPMNPLLVLPTGRNSPQSSGGGSGSGGAVASTSGAHNDNASSAGVGPNAVQRARAALGGGVVSKEHTSRSLWMLSRKFVRLLLTHTEPIPLVEAAAKLVTLEEADSPVYMTVERRLYDIGSILSCIGLIQKTYMGRNVCRARQPAYQWNANWQRDLLAGIADKSSSLPPPRPIANGTTHAAAAASRSHAPDTHPAPSTNTMPAPNQMYMPMSHAHGMMPTAPPNAAVTGQQPGTATAGQAAHGAPNAPMQGGHHHAQAATAYPTASSAYPASGPGAAAYQQQAAAAAAAAAAAYPYGPYPLQMMGHVLGMNAGMPMPFMLPQQPGVPTSQPAAAAPAANPYQLDPAATQKMYSMNPLSFLPSFMASPHPYFTHPPMAMPGHPAPTPAAPVTAPAPTNPAAPGATPSASTAAGAPQQPVTSPAAQAPAAAFPTYPHGMAYAAHAAPGTAAAAPAMMGHPVSGAAAAPVMPMPMPFMFNYAAMMPGAHMMAPGAGAAAAGTAAVPHPHMPQAVPQQVPQQQPHQHHLPQPQAPPQQQQQQQQQQQVPPQLQMGQQMMHMPQPHTQQQPMQVPQAQLQMGQLLPQPHHQPHEQHLPQQQPQQQHHLPQQPQQQQHHLPQQQPQQQHHLHPQQHLPQQMAQPQLPQQQQMHMQMHAPAMQQQDASCNPLPYAPLLPPSNDTSAASAAAAAVAAAATAAMQSGGISA